MNVQSIGDKLGLTSDQVRGCLRAIPTDIAIALPEHSLVDLVSSINTALKDAYRAGSTDTIEHQRREQKRNAK